MGWRLSTIFVRLTPKACAACVFFISIVLPVLSCFLLFKPSVRMGRVGIPIGIVGGFFYQAQCSSDSDSIGGFFPHRRKQLRSMQKQLKSERRKKPKLQLKLQWPQRCGGSQFQFSSLDFYP